MTPDDHQLTANRSRRWQAIRRTFGASIVAKGISIACTFAQVPIALHYLGSEAYGFWMALLSIALVVNFVDFGIGVSLQNLLSGHFASGDQPRMRAAYTSGALCLAGLSLVVLAIGAPIIAAGHWPAVFHLKDPGVSASARAALGVVIGTFAVGLPLNASARLAAAVQMGWIHAIWIAVGSVLALLFTVLATHWGASLPWFLFFACLAPILQGVGLHFSMMSKLRWSPLPRGLLTAREMHALLRVGFLFSAPQFGIALVQTLPPLVLTVTSGPAASAVFNVFQRLLSPVSQGQQLLLNPMWPALAEAHTRRDTAWLRTAFTFSLAATAALVGALFAVTSVSAPILRHWIGQSSLDVASSGLGWSVAAWTGTLMLGQPLLFFLLGSGRMKGLAIYGSIGHAAAILGLLLGGYWLGSRGALLLGAAAYLAIAVTGMAVECATELAKPPDPAADESAVQKPQDSLPIA